MQEKIPDNSIDLTVTSPPYDNLRKYNGFVFPFEEIAQQLYRVTKQGGVVVWVVADATIKGSETGTSFRQALYFKELGFNLHDTMIYERVACNFPDTVRYYQIFDYMFVLSKGFPKTFNPIRDRKNISFGRKVTGTARNTDGSTQRKACYGNTIPEYGIRNNIWRIVDGKRNNEHPASFYEQIPKDHILSWSNPGDIVLDPMCGSGTTLKMAKKNNRKYIGIDISEEYVALSKQRVELV